MKIFQTIYKYLLSTALDKRQDRLDIKNEKYLSKEEIKFITRESRKSFYKNPNLIILTNGLRSDIRKVSSETGLILVDGNDWFGFKHINKRHTYYQKEPNWNYNEFKTDILGRKFPKLDYPSRFEKNSIPIFDYLDVADQIYSPKNLNLEKNKNKEILELYIGSTLNTDSELNKEYRLLVYKKSKIIHTIFPTDRKTKKKKIKGSFSFIRKSVSAILEPKTSILMFKVPYFDYFDDERYIILIRRSYDPKIDKYYLQINEPKGFPAFTYFIMENAHKTEFSVENLKYPKELQLLNFFDFTSIENLIGKFEKMYFETKEN